MNFLQIELLNRDSIWHHIWVLVGCDCSTRLTGFLQVGVRRSGILQRVGEFSKALILKY